jgi:hypothetical protein
MANNVLHVSAISPIASFSTRFFARLKSLVAALVIMPFLFVPDVRRDRAGHLGVGNG